MSVSRSVRTFKQMSTVLSKEVYDLFNVDGLNLNRKSAEEGIDE